MKPSSSILENFLPQSVFRTYQKVTKEKMQDIMKRTKRITLGSMEYTNYVNEYAKTTQIHTYKKPEISEYPILKNSFVIPLRKPTYSCVSENFRRNKPQSFSETHYNSAKIVFSPLKQKIRIFKGNNIVPSETSISPSVKIDNGLLIDMLFFDGKYSKLSYKEEDIFHKPKKYEAFIIEHMNYLKKEISENYTNSLTRQYNENHIKMKMTSINLEFKCLSDPKIKHVVYTLPFDYLPLFYYKGFREFCYFLLAMVKFDIKNQSQIDIDTKSLHQFIKGYSFDKKRKDEPDQNKDDIKTIKEDPYKQKNEKNHSNVFHDIYTFIWNSPKAKFKVEIRLPEVSIEFKHPKKMIISSFINHEMMLYMLQKKFLNWDYYLVRYLISFKSFRWLVEGSLSKRAFLTKRNNIYTGRFHYHEKMINDFEYYRIDTIRHKNFASKGFQGKGVFLYFNTDNHYINHFHIIRNHQLSVTFSGFEYKFKFTFNQIKILVLITGQDNICDILSRLVILDHSTGYAQFDYAFFDAYDIETNRIDPLILEKVISNPIDIPITNENQHINLNSNFNIVEENGTINPASSSNILENTIRVPITKEYTAKLLPMILEKIKIDTTKNEIEKEKRDFKESNTVNMMIIDMKEWPKYISDNGIKILVEKILPFQKGKSGYIKGQRKTGFGSNLSPQKIGVSKFSISKKHSVVGLAITPLSGNTFKSYRSFNLNQVNS